MSFLTHKQRWRRVWPTRKTSKYQVRQQHHFLQVFHKISSIQIYLLYSSTCTHIHVHTHIMFHHHLPLNPMQNQQNHALDVVSKSASQPSLLQISQSSRLWATTGDLSNPKEQCRTRFNGAVKVVLIPTRIELHEAGLKDSLWWDHMQLYSFRKSAILANDNLGVDSLDLSVASPGRVHV